MGHSALKEPERLLRTDSPCLDHYFKDAVPYCTVNDIVTWDYTIDSIIQRLTPTSVQLMNV